MGGTTLMGDCAERAWQAHREACDHEWGIAGRYSYSYPRPGMEYCAQELYYYCRCCRLSSLDRPPGCAFDLGTDRLRIEQTFGLKWKGPLDEYA